MTLNQSPDTASTVSVVVSSSLNRSTGFDYHRGNENADAERQQPRRHATQFQVANEAIRTASRMAHGTRIAASAQGRSTNRANRMAWGNEGTRRHVRSAANICCYRGMPTSGRCVVLGSLA